MVGYIALCMGMIDQCEVYVLFRQRKITHEAARYVAKYDNDGLLEAIRIIYPIRPVPNKNLHSRHTSDLIPSMCHSKRAYKFSMPLWPIRSPKNPTQRVTMQAQA